MPSPVRFSYQTFITLDKKSSQPIYLQIAQELGIAIQRGILTCRQKLPGSRVLAQDLGVHRNTITRAYEELQEQGWIEIKQKSGAFVISLQERNSIKHSKNTAVTQGFLHKSGFSFTSSNLLSDPFEYTNSPLVFNHGSPDVSLAQIKELVDLYSMNMKRKSNQKKMGYYQERGSEYFKRQLSNYLNLTRALHINKHNLLISRSMEMSLYLLCQVLIKPLDSIVVGELSYFAANMIFQKVGGKILKVKVDNYGICTKDLRKICQNNSIRAIYTMPQGHYPTTCSMSKTRQLELIALAQEFDFIIFEDASDYDFSYSTNNSLSLIKQDPNARVVYIGSFGRSLAPGFRASFIVGPQDLIVELENYAGLIDRQGDVLMELALGEMIEEGSAVRHLNKSIQVYKKRRDNLALLLDTYLKEYFKYDLPNSGLAIWAQAKKPINLLKLSNLVHAKGLFIPKNILYQDKFTTGIRIGFGHLESNQMQTAIQIIANVLVENPDLVDK
ncbi:aminotransferase-like domain-containing protein [Myroides sp. LJL116]